MHDVLKGYKSYLLNLNQIYVIQITSAKENLLYATRSVFKNDCVHDISLYLSLSRLIVSSLYTK